MDCLDGAWTHSQVGTEQALDEVLEISIDCICTKLVFDAFNGRVQTEETFWLLHKETIKAVVSRVSLLEGRSAEIQDEQDHTQ